MIEGITASGFRYAVDERKIRDWRTVKKISRLMKQENEAEAEIAAMDLVSDILGEEQEERLISHVEKLHGYADALVVSREFFEMFGAIRKTEEGKNFQSSHGQSAIARESSLPTSPSIMAYSGTREQIPAPQQYY